jgi:hypothetical protein
MDVYSCKVRLDGSLDNEVIKHNVTAAEIHVLSNIHLGQGKHPPVVDIVKTGSVNRSDIKERARLADIYTKGELVEDRGTRIITGMFGVAGVPLPQTYVAPETVAAVEYNPAEDEEDEVITPVEAPVRATTLRDSKLSLKNAPAQASA